VIDYRSLIHDRIHESYEFGKRRVKGFNYNQFFATTDVMLDVGGIFHLSESSPWPNSDHEAKIWFYGAMQALSVEQDASKLLIECFGIRRLEVVDHLLPEIREIRIAAVGHPAKHTSKKLDFPGCTYLGQRDGERPQILRRQRSADRPHPE